MIFSVSEANNFIKALLDAVPQLQTIFVRGEISNYKLYPSGHHYFTLKDEGSALKCVMFRGMAGKLRFRPENGMKVIAFGRISVFPRDGAYQLYCSELSVEGVGDLHVAFEQLKEKLFKEGLFAPEHKKPLPKYPKRIAIITSSAGAAVHDMLRILNARWPMSEVVLLPVRVQGAEAPPEIAGALRYANKWQVADLIITGRGGGSIEDLWAFNEEEVARAIFACNTPVISAVGHETDVTIADYAADLRAPTPSAAAELAVFDYFQFRMDLNARKQRLMKEMGTSLERAKSRLKHDELTLRFYDPKSQLNEKKKRLADAEDTLLRLIAERQQETGRDLQNAETLLRRSMADRLAADKRNLAVKSERLWGLSPLKKISGGFGFITDGDGKRLETVEQAEAGKRITVRVKDGRIGAVVDHVEKYR